LAPVLTEPVTPAYLPERLVLLNAMPMTAAGKVQKFVLREQARAMVSGEALPNA
jgi:acyl-coenzyme A synthetase/AMP-(fatty) acid ligase